MKIHKNKAKRNIEYARCWLNRAIKDFNHFKKLVPFNKRTNKPVRCSDPAMAVYLLQQSLEKAVKAVAIASGQYEARDFIHYYSHNSLALIINLYNKIIAQMQAIGLEPIAKMLGIDLGDSESKLRSFENQIRGVTPLLDKNGKEVDFRSASIGTTSEVIDQMINMIMQIRTLTLDVIRTIFNVLPSMGIHHGQGVIDDPEAFLRKLTNLVISAHPKLRPPSEEQLKVPLEFAKYMNGLGFKPVGEFKRQKTIINYLGVWALSTALLFLTYFTFAHESTSRYPLKHKGNIKTGKIGCDDYDENLGIVNRIGKIGYVTGLT